MIRVPRKTLLPALAFALALAGAAAVSLAGGRSPEARLRDAVRAYAAALAAGDAETAAAWRADGGAGLDAGGATGLRGYDWVVQGSKLAEGGLRALVEVIWIDPQGHEYGEVEVWGRTQGGGWRFLALQG